MKGRHQPQERYSSGEEVRRRYPIWKGGRNWFVTETSFLEAERLCKVWTRREPDHVYYIYRLNNFTGEQKIMRIIYKEKSYLPKSWESKGIDFRSFAHQLKINSY